MKRLIVWLCLTALVSLACGQAAGTPDLPIEPSKTVNAGQSTSAEFTISVEYGILGLAKTYQPTGVTYSKLQDVFAIWGNIEPVQGTYQWGPTDALVLEYQQAGFSGLQFNLTALSDWAASKPPQLSNQGDTFPKPEYLDDYADFVTAVVERYDGDGVQDMPGLIYPIREWGIEREFTGFWPGSADEYVQLLRIAYPAIKAADPQANVLLVALLMADIFDGDPNPAELARRLETPLDFMRKSVPEIKTILAACDSYDMVDFHALGNYTEIPPTTRWIREQLAQMNCGEKPIWIGDAFPMSALVGYGGFVPPTPFAPVTLERRDEVVALLKSVADPGEATHQASQDWMYAETAINLVRKIIVSAAEGLRGINIGNMEDWKTGLAGVDKAAVPMLGGSMFMGLTDTRMTQVKPGGELPAHGPEWSNARQAGDLRPAWVALQLVTGMLADFTSVTTLELGNSIYAYQFERPQGFVWILWVDDGGLYLPGEESPTQTISLPFSAGQARLTLTPTQRGQSQPDVQVLSAENGNLEVNLGYVPIFIEEVQP